MLFLESAVNMGEMTHGKDFWGNDVSWDDKGNEYMHGTDFFGNSVTWGSDGSKVTHGKDIFGNDASWDNHGNEYMHGKDIFGNQATWDKYGHEAVDYDDFFGTHKTYVPDDFGTDGRHSGVDSFSGLNNSDFSSGYSGGSSSGYSGGYSSGYSGGHSRAYSGGYSSSRSAPYSKASAGYNDGYVLKGVGQLVYIIAAIGLLVLANVVNFAVPAFTTSISPKALIVIYVAASTLFALDKGFKGWLISCLISLVLGFIVGSMFYSAYIRLGAYNQSMYYGEFWLLQLKFTAIFGLAASFAWLIISHVKKKA